MKFNDIEDLPLENKSVLVRLDLNVPIKNGRISDDSRITAALPTLQHLLKRDCKIAIMSHLGRPKGKANPDYSLQPVGERLAELLNKEILLIADYHKEPADQVLKQLGKNQILLLENLRFHSGETNNDKEFAQTLIKGIDYYINDAFGAAHRNHASVVAVPNLLSKEKSTVGLLMKKEIQALQSLQLKAKAPYTVIMGGAKVSDKISVMLSLINQCNNLIIGGAMAYTFLKYKGVDIGKSRYEDDKMELVEAIYRNAEARKVRIYLPVDHIAAEQFSEDATPHYVESQDIPQNLMGLDIGEKTRLQFNSVIRNSETVLWNGPMGVFEWSSFSEGTMSIAQELAQNSGYTVVGGGDSVAAIRRAGIEDQLSHVSTGGGASLEFLEGVGLPGLKALEL